MIRAFSVACCIIAASTFMSFSQNANVIFRDQLNYPGQSLANIGGYIDELGNEYALVCASLGISVVDISDPDNVVEIVQIAGPDNFWREVKVYGDYAYVTTEEGGTGLQIIDLSPLPGSSTLPNHYWTPSISGDDLGSIHALHIDTAQGFVYCFGSNVGNGGAVIGDLNTDPYNPVYVGSYDNEYIHDGFVDDDTLFAGHIYAGNFKVVDMTDKSNPDVLATQQTPGNFTHNAWLSDDRNYIFTTDEVSNSYLTSYDVSDLSDIKELDRMQCTPGSGSIVHNTHVKGDWAVSSWYRDGFNIVDISHPDILVEVGRYDSYSGSGDGFNGAWGVYPFFPSGTVVISDIEGELVVVTPTYVHAAYIQGNVMDGNCGMPLNNATITILTSGVSTTTDISGDYSEGIAGSGTYTVEFSKAGYQTQSISVNFVTGIVQTVDVTMIPLQGITLSGTVEDALTGNPIANAQVWFDSPTTDYEISADANGQFSICSFNAETYDIYCGKWGYMELLEAGAVLDINNNTVTIPLSKGYYDDFLFDLGWTENGDASTGAWERGDPEGTDLNNDPSNPEDDVTGEFGESCMSTGLAGGGQAGANDVDNGNTVLTSQIMDMTTYSDPFITYSRWFFNEGGGGNPNDELTFRISDGTNTYPIETITWNANENSWNKNTIRVLDFIPLLTNSVRFITETADQTPGHIVEAAFDYFFVSDSISSTPPVAEFTADADTVCEGDFVQFTDLSSNNPTSWSWALAGGTPATSNLPDPLVQYNTSGTYDVTLTVANAAGSSAMLHAGAITVLDAAEITNATLVNPTDIGASNGSITLSVSGGVAPCTFLWSNGATTQSINNLPAGTYSVTITCANGCNEIGSYDIGVGVGIETVATTNELNIYPNPFAQQATLTYDLTSTARENVFVVVTNILGEEIQRIQLSDQNGTITIGNNYKPGFYFITLSSDEISFHSLKFLKSE